jgi:RHS repeat-associated protein
VNANGNLTARGSDSFAYDQANRLTSATVSGTTSSYLYDGDGKRTSKTVGRTPKYVYGLGLTYAVNGSGNVQVYHTDGLGSVRAITNRDDRISVIETYQTDAFGVPTQTQGGVSQPFPFTGQQRDASTGLYYLRARVYDPNIGRFLSQDPFHGFIRDPLSLGRYAYVQNNPATLLDPTGLYEYYYEWYIGPASIVGSPESVMTYFQQHPRDVFPFDLGQCDTIKLNERCDLVTFGRQAPVPVTAVPPTSFTFTALPGHFDPTGSTITFSIYSRHGSIYLAQKAHALRPDEGSLLDPATAIAAWVTWSDPASNLTNARLFGFRFLVIA